MTPLLSVPDPLPLPAPAWLLSALLVLMFVLHTLSMNLLVGGAIVALVARVRGRRNQPAAALARLLAGALPVAFAAAIAFGVAALLFLQALYGRVFFSAAVLVAVPWLLVVPLLVLAYYGSYLVAAAGKPAAIEDGESKIEKGSRSTAILAASAAIALLLIGIAFIHANVMSAMARPQMFGRWFLDSATGLRLNLDDPTLAPRFLHGMIGAAAVAGAAIAVGGYLLRRRDAALSAWMIRDGVLWCAIATVVNLIPGFWWLAALPAQTMLRFMGRDMSATLWLVGGILSAVAALGHLVPASMVGNPRSLLAGGAGSLAAAVVCMSMVRDIARRAALETAGFEPTRWVAPQWSAIAVFAVLLVVAIVTVAWMVRVLARA